MDLVSNIHIVDQWRASLSLLQQQYIINAVSSQLSTISFGISLTLSMLPIFCILAFLLKTNCFYLRLAILVTGRLIVVTKWRKWRHSPAKMETALSMPLQFWRPPAFVSKTNQPAAQIFCVPNLQTWGGTLGIRHCKLGGPTLHKQGEKPPRQFKCLIHS